MEKEQENGVKGKNQKKKTKRSKYKYVPLSTITNDPPIPLHLGGICIYTLIRTKEDNPYR